VDARMTATMVQIIAAGDVVATHVRAEKGRRTNFDHYPPEKIAFHMRTPTWCRKTAAQVGPACVQVIAGLLVDNALFRLRAAQGVLGLREGHTPGRLEAACTKAIAVGDPSYRTIKGILIAGTEAPDHGAELATGGRDVPAFLRGAHDLFTDQASEPGQATNVVALPTPNAATTSQLPAAASAEAGA